MINKTMKYFPLIFSPFASQLGSAIYILGLNWLLVQATGNTKLLGLIEGLGGFAFLLGDFLVGILVDQCNRKKVLVWTDVFATVVCLLGSIFINNGKPQIWLLIVITSVLNLMLAINYPAAKAIIPEVIEKDYLQRFNAISNTFFNMANIIAPIIGGALLAIKSITFSEFLIANAFSYLVAFFMNLLIPYKYSATPRKKESIVSSNIIGFNYVRHHPNLLAYMLAMGIFNFNYAGFSLTTPYIANHFFAGNSASYSMFLVISAIGGLLGGVWLMLQKSKIKPEVIYIEQILYGCVLILCGCFFSIITWMIIAFIYGIFQARFFGSIITFIQNETNGAFLGRVFGLTFLFFDGIQPIGSFIYGFFISTWQQETYIILGLCLLIFFVALLYKKAKFKI